MRRSAGSNGTRLAAMPGDEMIGYIEVGSRDDTGRLLRSGGWTDISNLQVAEGYRRRGVATWLMGQAAEWLRRSDRPHDLGHDDWLKLAGPNGCWDDIPGEMDPEHPKPFHLEVPRRLIRLYSYRDDLVGDLFLGRGSTALACVELGRRFRGGDRSPTYKALAEHRVAIALEQAA